MKTNKKMLLKAVNNQENEEEVDLVKLFNNLGISARDLYYAIEANYFLDINSIGDFLPDKYIEDYISLSKSNKDFVNEIKSNIADIANDYEGSVPIEDFLDDLKHVVIENIQYENEIKQ